MDSDLISNAMELTLKAAEKILDAIPGARRRRIKERSGWPRRRELNRRVSGPDQRLRSGFWRAFQRRTDLGKFEQLELTWTMRDQVFQALVLEAQHYEFSDRTSGSTLEPATIVDAAIDVVWKGWEAQPRESRQAVLIIEEIARYLTSKYNIRKVDRRTMKRRAVAAS